MTRLLTCGWETNNLEEIGSIINNSTTHSLVTSNPTPRSPGVYCYKILGPGTSSGYGARQVTFAASKTEIWARFGFYSHAYSGPFFWVLDSAGNTQGVLTCSSTDGLIRVATTWNGTIYGTSTLTMAADLWHTVEVRWQITSATVGTTEVWVDGTRFLNLVGVDNTNSGTLNIQSLILGDTIVFDLASGIFMAFDDLAVNDTNGTINNGQIGDGRVVLLKPNGAGSNTNQTRGGTDSGSNWDQCNELPPSMTDYVYSSTVGTRDTYALEDVPAGTWGINAVEVIALGMTSDYGAGSLGLTIKSGATTNEGSAQSLVISPVTLRQLYETDPNTSAAWTVVAVNALEAGTTVR